MLFDGKDVTHLPTEQRNIAQVFQFPVIYDTMTVAENLAFPLKNWRVERWRDRGARGRDRATARSDRDLDRRARGLSAEAKQKISLGRGLVRPDVAAVLFDEPLTVIDPALKWELRSKLKAVHRALDLLMIYVTHDQVEALTFADEVVVMKDGRVAADRHARGTVRAARAHLRWLFHRLARHEPDHGESVRRHARACAGHDYRTRRAAIRKPPTASGRSAFRPDFASLAPDGGIPVQVRRVEDLGRRRLARVALGPHEIFANVPDGVSIASGTRPGRIRSSRIGSSFTSTTNSFSEIVTEWKSRSTIAPG